MSSLGVTYHCLDGKNVLITGGAEGIGAATVEHFVFQGCQVIFLDINEDAANRTIIRVLTLFSETLQGRLSKTVQEPVFYKCDLTDLDALRNTLAAILERFHTIDVLVNNAAAAGGSSRIATPDVTPAAFDYSINANLRHVFFCTQHLLPSLKASRGCIINLGSITWRIPASDVPVYSACKAAIMGLTRAHSKEFGKWGVRVNSVMPGAIATERQRKEVLTEEYRNEVMRNQSLQRDLEPGEVAGVVVFLASTMASGVTGSSYVVDGGWCGDP